jgi:hypothetical protein
MSAIYSNAVCCIAFLFPPVEGFNRPRMDPRHVSPCIVRKGTSQSNGVYIALRGDWNYPWLPENCTWPWSSRAWTFQEYLLSPRTIFYGHENIMWECSYAFCDDLIGTRCPSSYKSKVGFGKERLTDKAHVSTKSPVKVRTVSKLAEGPLSTNMDSWMKLVRDYRTRDLTKASDRVMALVGVAEAFGHNQELTYLAGVWAEHLPHCLLWYVLYKRRPNPHDDRPRQDDLWTVREAAATGVPSWSWLGHTIYTDDEFEPSSYTHMDDPYLVSEAAFVHFQWPNQPLNVVPDTALYNFAGLELTLRLATFTTMLRKSKPRKAMQVFQCPDLEEQIRSGIDGTDIGTVIGDVTVEYHSDIPEEVEKPPSNVLLVLLYEAWDMMTSERGCNFSIGMDGLGLKPGKRENTWERVGYWSTTCYVECIVEPDEIRQSAEQDDRTDINDTLPTSSTKGAKQTQTRYEESIFLQLKGAKIETLTLV